MVRQARVTPLVTRCIEGVPIEVVRRFLVLRITAAHGESEELRISREEAVR